MLDALLRPLKERWLAPAAHALGRRVAPMTVTLAGFVAGLAAAIAAAFGTRDVALLLWIVNRVLDGFDGTLARAQGAQSDLGGYVDLLLDFVVYAAIPLGLVLGAPSLPRAVAAVALVGSFYVNAASWMYLSALLERRGDGARARGELTSVTMPAGLIGGTETIVFYTLFFAWPAQLVALFAVMTALVLVTVVLRLAWAIHHLRT
ncbi:MAG: CDP-alcohol phosphatidyltransferase family protein [Gemmatimonadaceae bacterium]|nr:CDP-alcohol phosphatidyltransferase family protein [Gemmatimonadaceae bacterium]